MNIFKVTIETPFRVDLNDLADEYYSYVKERMIVVNSTHVEIVNPSDASEYSIVMNVQTCLEELYYNDYDYHGRDYFFDVISIDAEKIS